ncbi:MAG: glycosyltransferase family 2 protein [Terrimicrobiaceae bacterium]
MSKVVAVVVTWRRERELERLLTSLESSSVPLQGCVVMDHAGTLPEETARRSFPVRIVRDLSNPGPGAGWANGTLRAGEIFGETDILYLDDDVVIPPDTLEILLRERGEARAICPLLEDGSGHLWGFPEPVSKADRKTIRAAKTPWDALALLGPGPFPFCWATGACLLVTAGGIIEVGLHRKDFWMLGEDLEFSMRLAAGGGAVFTCLAAVPHLPPDPLSAAEARDSDYRKFCSLLQNLSYLSFHSSRSGHLWRYLPGNFRRFFRTHGMRAGAVLDAAICFWQGAVSGHPAGHKSGDALRERIARRKLRR